MLARIDSIDTQGHGVVLLLILVGDLERCSLKARGEDKHVLEFPFLHVLWEANDKDGRNLFLVATIAVARVVEERASVAVAVAVVGVVEAKEARA